MEIKKKIIILSDYQGELSLKKKLLFDMGCKKPTEEDQHGPNLPSYKFSPSGNYYPLVPDEETEAQRDGSTCPKSIKAK